MKRPWVIAAILTVAMACCGRTVYPDQTTTCSHQYHTIPASAIKVHLPEVQQPEDYSCGTAATMSILAYYGVGPDDYRVLRKKLGTTRKNGTDYQRIVRYINTLTTKYGIKAVAQPRMTLEQLDQCLGAGRPVVCSIQAYDEDTPPGQLARAYREKNDSGHYVVAIGYDKENYYFMDPSLTGRRGYLPRKEFEERWHDNEGTQDQPNVICHLGIVVWMDNGRSAYAHCARRID